MRAGRARRAVLTGLAAAWALAGSAGPAAAADRVTFGQPTADSRFAGFIEFEQPVTLEAAPQRIEVLLSTPGAVGPTVIPVAPDRNAGASTLEYRIDLTDGHIVPNTTFTVRWRIVDDADKAWLGPSIGHTYTDDRAAWKTLEGDVVRVHWRDGDQAFGQRALAIGDEAVAETAKLLGVTESEPIDFFIYGDQDSFYAALGPATRENVGGQAHPHIRTLFALIAPAEIGAGWVESVVPHELVHLVFATAIDNPYHDPPHWLNEGLAVYLSDGYADSDRQQVEQAARDGTIIPLAGLAGAFPTTRERFFLAYAESVSAVARMVDVHGRDALVQLIRSYANGVSDDEAFEAALGRTVAEFEAEWLGDLGASPPTKRGPVAAPAGPLPEGWAGPVPNPSFEVPGSSGPPAPGSPSGPIPTSPQDDPLARFLVSSVSLIGVALVVVIGAVAIRRARRRTDPAAWAVQGDNRLFGRPPSPDDAEAEAADVAEQSASPTQRSGNSGWAQPRDADEDARWARPDPGTLPVPRDEARPSDAHDPPTDR